MGSMITVDTRPQDAFTMISNGFARDSRVTPRAARLYIYLMSHSAGWKLYVTAAAGATGMGRNTVYKAINDLRELGYIQRRQLFSETGDFAGYDYRVYAHPVPVEERDVTSDDDAERVPESGKRDDRGKQDETPGEPRLPHLGIPDLGIPRRGTLKKNNLQEEQPQEEQEEDPPQPPKGGESGDDFEAFWAAYPRRVAKQAAQRAFRKAIRQASLGEILEGLEASKRSWLVEGRDKTKLPYPVTWLNQGRWEDEETTGWDTVAPGHSKPTSATERLRQRISGPVSGPSGPGEQRAEIGGGVAYPLEIGGRK